MPLEKEMIWILQPNRSHDMSSVYCIHIRRSGMTKTGEYAFGVFCRKSIFEFPYGMFVGKDQCCILIQKKSMSVRIRSIGMLIRSFAMMYPHHPNLLIITA